jgi:hypothetical protein
MNEAGTDPRRLAGAATAEASASAVALAAFDRRFGAPTCAGAGAARSNTSHCFHTEMQALVAHMMAQNRGIPGAEMTEATDFSILFSNACQKKYACISVLLSGPANRPQIAPYQAVQEHCDIDRMGHGAWSMMRQDPDGLAARAGISRARHIGAKAQHSLSMLCLPAAAAASNFLLPHEPRQTNLPALQPQLTLPPPHLSIRCHWPRRLRSLHHHMGVLPSVDPSVYVRPFRGWLAQLRAPLLLQGRHRRQALTCFCVTAHRKGALRQESLPPQHAGGLTPSSRV